jgi:hypothetical protein
MKITELILIFLLANITGGWMATMIVFARGYRRMSAASYIEAEQTNSDLACKYFAPMIGLTLITSIVSLLQLGVGTLASNLTAVSAGLLLITAIFVKAKVLPLNDKIKTWDRANPPADWRQVRSRWIRLHTIRTILGLIVFFLQAYVIIWQ